MVTVLRSSLTTARHAFGKNRPSVSPPGTSWSGAPRFSISGHILPAPKLEKSHHLIPGLAFTAPLKSGQPVAKSDATTARPARSVRVAERGYADAALMGSLRGERLLRAARALALRRLRARRRGKHDRRE